VLRNLENAEGRIEPRRSFNSHVAFGTIFNAKYNIGETLLNASARIQSIAAKIVEQEGRAPTWEEIICFRIMSIIPSQYDAIQQSIFQTDWKKINIKLIDQKFNSEDARQVANKKIEDEKRQNSNQNNNAEQAMNTQQQKKQNNNNKSSNSKKGDKKGDKIKRECSICHKDISNSRPHFKICFDCHQASQSSTKTDHDKDKKNDKKLKDKKEDANAVQVLSATTFDKSSIKSKEWYLDSACTRHVTNSTFNCNNLKKSDRSICGPSGEIVKATKEGDFSFQVENGKKLIFKDALVVPDLRKNLLSVKQIVESAPDIFVIFNQNRCQVFRRNSSKWRNNCPRKIR
jgi:hypothetical protein